MYNLCVSGNPINIMNTVSITVPHRGILPVWGWILAVGRLTPPFVLAAGAGLMLPLRNTDHNP
jgi:hypothetical protein